MSIEDKWNILIKPKIGWFEINIKELFPLQGSNMVIC